MTPKNYSVRLASVNARGCNNIKKKAALAQWMTSNKYTILNLQETHLTAEKLPNFNKSFEGECIHSHSNSNHSRGVATILNKEHKLEINSKCVIRITLAKLGV